MLNELTGTFRLIGLLLYGSGLRLTECLELRVKDLDLERRQIIVRRGKGDKDRAVPLPESVRALLPDHLRLVRRTFEADHQHGVGGVVMPSGLGRKFPNAPREWAWQFVFPAGRVCRDPQWGGPTRFHLHESAVQREVTAAVRRSGIAKRVTCHTFRHYADSRIMPPAMGAPLRVGGDRAFPNVTVGIIRDVRERRAVDPSAGTDLASRRPESCVPALAL